MDRLADVARRLGATVAGTAPLTGGVSARITALDLARPGGATERVVVREPGAAAWKAGEASTARREHELLGHLHRAGLPVPRPLLLDEQPPPLFVMSFVDGTREIPPRGVEAMADLLARVHALPLDGLPPLPELEDPRARLPELLGPGHEDACARFAAPTRAPRRALLHGDFWPGNVLWRGDAIAALIDWEAAALGDPLSDLACCRLELRYVAGAAGADALTRRYVERARPDLDDLALWDAYVAAAALGAMGQWGLPAEREARMRREAEASLALALASA